MFPLNLEVFHHLLRDSLVFRSGAVVSLAKLKDLCGI